MNRSFLVNSVAAISLFISGNLAAVFDGYCKEGPSQECRHYIENLSRKLGELWPIDEKTKEPLESVAFIIEDPEFKIQSSLLNYVKSIYLGDICQETIFSRQSAYPRKSTHLNDLYLYKKQATKSFLGSISKTCSDAGSYVHYGIDPDPGTAKTLPAGKKHILFGRVGIVKGSDHAYRDLTFIKFEAHGLQGMSVIGHTADLIKSKFKKNGISRKERVSKDLLKAFEKLLVEFYGKNDMGAKEYLKQAKALGIHKIISIIDEFNFIEKNYLSEKKMVALGKFNEFRHVLKIRYPADYCTRIGNEIIPPLQNKCRE